jgi:hypothetical protein
LKRSFPLQTRRELLFSATALAVHAAESRDVDYFTDNGFGNPSSTLQHPTGVNHNGTTYIAYQGPHEDSYVAAYHHATRKWSGPFLAGVNLMGKSPDPVENKDLDNHGKPAMMVDKKGYIHIVFGAHGGSPSLGKNTLGTPGSLRGGKFTHMVSTNPEDISAFVELDNISPFGTYPQFVQMDNGDMYLFYRHGAHRSDWVYQRSGDLGRTFQPPVSILKHKAQQSNPAVHDSWYAWFAKGHGETITASYVYHLCENPGHTNDRSNSYFMRMNTRDGSWVNAAGEKLTISVTKEYADRKTLIYNTGTERCSHGTCRVDGNGNPHVNFRYGKGQVRYCRWTGTEWTKPSAILPNGGASDGDLVVESPTSARMILTSRNGDTAEVGWWKTIDGGTTWDKEPPILAKSGGSYDIGALIENFNQDAVILLSEEVPADYLYRRMILLSNKGPVKRPAVEASFIQDKLKALRDAGVAPETKESRALGKPNKKRKGA